MNTTLTPPSDQFGSTSSSANGSARSEPLPLSPPRTMRSRAPQALLAALLIVGGGLGGLILFSRYNQRVPAVVMAAPVAHGQPIDRGDLAVAEVALDGRVATLGSIDQVVGRLAAHDLQPGELVTAADLTTDERLVAGDESVIGLLLEPGQYPTIRLAVGDRVDVFAPGSADRPRSDSDFVAQGSTSTSGPLAADLVVYDVVESSSDGRNLLVSIVVSSEQASMVFDAAEAGGVRLSLRGEG